MNCRFRKISFEILPLKHYTLLMTISIYNISCLLGICSNKRRRRKYTSTEKEEECAAQPRKMEGSANQRSSEDGQITETSKTRQKESDQQEILCIGFVISKMRFFDVWQNAFIKERHNVWNYKYYLLHIYSLKV